jgi:hypothetical protein
MTAALEAHWNSGGITGMENNRHESRNRPGLPIANMRNHRGDLGFKAGNKLGDFVKPAVDLIQPRPQDSHISCHLAPDTIVTSVAPEHGIKPAWLPSESNRQRFQCSRATPTLNGVQLDFPHNRRRDTRPFRKLTLSPAKLADSVADYLGDRSPVFSRHAFRHASSSAFRFQRRH